MLIAGGTHRPWVPLPDRGSPLHDGPDSRGCRSHEEPRLGRAGPARAHQRTTGWPRGAAPLEEPPNEVERRLLGPTDDHGPIARSADLPLMRHLPSPGRSRRCRAAPSCTRPAAPVARRPRPPERRAGSPPSRGALALDSRPGGSRRTRRGDRRLLAVHDRRAQQVGGPGPSRARPSEPAVTLRASDRLSGIAGRRRPRAPRRGRGHEGVIRAATVSTTGEGSPASSAGGLRRERTLTSPPPARYATVGWWTRKRSSRMLAAGLRDADASHRPGHDRRGPGRGREPGRTVFHHLPHSVGTPGSAYPPTVELRRSPARSRARA
jgi:hypothetical protein